MTGQFWPEQTAAAGSRGPATTISNGRCEDPPTFLCTIVRCEEKLTLLDLSDHNVRYQPLFDNTSHLFSWNFFMEMLRLWPVGQSAEWCWVAGHRGEARLNISWYNLQFGNHSQSYHPNHPTGARGGGQNGGDITAVNFSPHTISLCTSLHQNSCVDNIDNVDNSWVDNNLVKLTRRPPQFQRIINLKS